MFVHCNKCIQDSLSYLLMHLGCFGQKPAFGAFSGLLHEAATIQSKAHALAITKVTLGASSLITALTFQYLHPPQPKTKVCQRSMMKIGGTVSKALRCGMFALQPLSRCEQSVFWVENVF